MNLLPRVFPRDDDTRKKDFENSLIKGEAKLGGRLFGPVPRGHHRAFFCLDEHTWIWHEEWKDENGQQKVLTTRYTVRPNGILKSQNGQAYQAMSDTETRNLHKAVNIYADRVSAAYEHMLAA